MTDAGFHGRVHETFFHFELLPGVGHEQESPVTALQSGANGVFILQAAGYDLDTGLAHRFCLSGSLTSPLTRRSYSGRSFIISVPTAPVSPVNKIMFSPLY